MVNITIDRALDGSLNCETKIRKADAEEASHQFVPAVVDIRKALLDITPSEIAFVTAMAEGEAHD